MPRRTTSSLVGPMHIALLALLVCSAAFSQVRYDLVIRGGRVIDPETSFDAVRDVGIRGNQIAAISERPLTGARVIDASGLVVAPGFIDLHQHDLSAAGYRLKAMDGVTTALELEIGPPDVRKFLDQRRNAALINYGTSASHPWARAASLGRPAANEAEILPPSSPATNEPASPEQIREHAATSARRTQRRRAWRGNGNSVHARGDAPGNH